MKATKTKSAAPKRKPKAAPKAATGKPRKNWGWPSVLGRDSVSKEPGIFFRCPPELKAETIEIMRQIYPHGTKTLAQYLIEAMHEKNQRELMALQGGEGSPRPSRQRK